MRIAILGSVALPVPPPFQGGTEWIAYYQAEGLASLGHKIILFAARGSKKGNYELAEVGGGDTVAGSNLVMGSAAESAQVGLTFLRTSQTPPIFHRGRDRGRAQNASLSADSNYFPKEEFVESSRNLRKENVYLGQVIEKLIQNKDEYDLILNNMRGEGVLLPIAKLLHKPLANVMHLPLFEQLAMLFKEYNTHIITISNAQRKGYPDLNYLATVSNCVDTDKYLFNETPEDYLLMVGTIGAHKNQKGAIEVAKRAGMRLVLAGKIRDQKYFEEIKKDIDGKNIKWFGELGFEEKLKLYQNARAFIFPILWEEPFGLVMIEAMACGTPVVAFSHGAIPEVVVHSKNGFIIENDSIEEMANAVKNIEVIERSSCRAHVTDNFTVAKMVHNYEKALTQL